MIEVRGRSWRKKDTVLQEVPGWYLGTAVTGGNDYGPTRSHFALGENGKLYMNWLAVGDRREFTTGDGVRWEQADEVHDLLRLVEDAARLQASY